LVASAPATFSDIDPEWSSTISSIPAGRTRVDGIEPSDGYVRNSCRSE